MIRMYILTKTRPTHTVNIEIDSIVDLRAIWAALNFVASYFKLMSKKYNLQQNFCNQFPWKQQMLVLCCRFQTFCHQQFT